MKRDGGRESEKERAFQLGLSLSDIYKFSPFVGQNNGSFTFHRKV